MTHKPWHSGGTPGASGPPGRNYPVSKSSINPYKQAAESMKSAGIKSLSGATTSDDKGKKAKKIQEDYRSNQNKDSIIPKPKPKPDEEKVKDDYKTDKLILSKTAFNKKYADKLDRPTSVGIMKQDDTYTNPYALKYDVSLSGGEIPGLMETYSLGKQYESFDETFIENVLNELVESKNDISYTDLVKLMAGVVKQYVPEDGPLTSVPKPIQAATALGSIVAKKEFEPIPGVVVSTTNWKDNMTVLIDILKLLEDK